MVDLPTFTLVVVGTVSDSAAVETKLGELLRRKLKTHHVVLHAGGSVRLPAAVFALRHNLPLNPIPEPEPRDPNGTGRNTELLRVGSAFLVFGREADWTSDVADLVLRARAVGLKVRMVEE